MDLIQARANLDAVFGDELRAQYFACLRQWFLFSSNLPLEQLDVSIRKLFSTDEQYKIHKEYILALTSKEASSPERVGNRKEVGNFETADFAEHVRSSSPNHSLPSKYEYKSAAAELFAPDSKFITARIEISAWENGMKEAETGVSDFIAHACKSFLKNIITAMITKAKGYKIRENKFQYNFNMPIPDPYIRNYKNVVEEPTDSSMDIDLESTTLQNKISLEQAEQEVAYSSSKRIKTGVTLSKKLLYETIRDNPGLLGLHSIQSVNLLKLGLIYDEDNEDPLMSDDDSE
ncbi:hypothetical protein GWI33_019010 [Rhynchophorus ferrugineus]|uniref:Transcriptional adapter 1-like protein n=1 Tax=Rhynchophorus ferrugineus TaxID=354439 RepID=A0A834HUR8_RHYFE|nr:hypothetical protein GWI33_019010 [Rhynchophorus ferrugineus]